MGRGLLIVSGGLAWCLSLPAGATDIRTSDGLKLEFSAPGRVTRVTAGRVALPLRGAGGFAVADFRDQPEPQNLVPNGGFEEGTTGWSLSPGQALDTTISRSGRASARLGVPGPEPAQSNLEAVVPVKPSTRYQAGMWLGPEK